MFEDLLYAHLCGNSGIIESLCSYGDAPAIFNQKPPDDMDSNWENTQCPRAVYFISRQADPERHISGEVVFHVFCHDLNEIEVEDLEYIFRDALDGYFFGTDTETISTKWLNTSFESFSVGNDQLYSAGSDGKIDTAIIHFELIEYPIQNLDVPDVCAALQGYTKSEFPNATVIGLDGLDNVFKPSNLSPAIYWRVSSIVPCSWIHSTYAGNWYTANMVCHIIAPDYQIKSNLARTLMHKMNAKKCLRLSDDTLMRIDRQNRIVPGNDELRAGQLTAECTYAVLNIETSEMLNNIYIANRKEV